MMGTNSINYSEDKYVLKSKTAKALLWVSIGSMIMLFAALTSAYIVRQAEGNWLEFDLPQAFWYSTAIILLSSVSMNWATSSIKKNNFRDTKIALIVTLFLGAMFVGSQFLGYKQLIAEKIFFTGKASNVSGSFLYILSGVHLAHLAGGIIALTVVLYKAIRKKYNANNRLGIQLCATFWHFLDILWVYLFLFLLFIR